MRTRDLFIGDKQVGSGGPCFIIAEIGVNHNGNLGLARKTIDAAVRAGADAVKFQTYTTEKLVSDRAPKAGYQVRNTGKDGSQFAMLKQYELSREDHLEMRDYCQNSGIEFLSSAFHSEAVDLLDDIGVSAYKTPSGEITNLAYLRYIAAKGRPMIISTGMATMAEIAHGLEAVRSAGDPDVILLQCLSNYPADPAEVNLSAMQSISRAFGVPVGYSDHTTGIAVSIGAVALGACVIEKHITIDKTLPGPDHKASIEPDEFKEMVDGMRVIEAAIGDGVKRPMPSEIGTREIARKSLCSTGPLSEGTVLREEHIALLRPGTGLAPELAPYILGRRVLRDVEAAQPITADLLEGLV